MKTYEQVLNLKVGEVANLGNSPVGGVTARRTAKGVIVTNSNGNWYVKEEDIPNSIGNQNAIGLQSLEYAIRTPNAA